MQAVITSREEWLAARQALLEEEKAFQRQRDTLSAKRRELPWVAVSEDYSFETPTGRKSLGDLFAGPSPEKLKDHLWASHLKLLLSLPPFMEHYNSLDWYQNFNNRLRQDSSKQRP